MALSRSWVLTFIAITACVFLAVAPDAANSASTRHRDSDTFDYETLHSCLTSFAVPRSQILSRDDPLDAERYQAVNWQWNMLNGTINPFLYLEARHEGDVAAAVRCCAALGIRAVAKAGGHSYAKYGFGDAESLIVDLQLMNTVEVDSVAEVATIGAGTRQGKILADLWAAGGWVLPVGNCPTVGFAGYVLGGGFGSYSRWLGLGSDRLLEVTLVDSRGAVLTVNNVTDAELFWALRGGGGGNFGIVTRMKFRLTRAPDHVVQGVVTYSWDQFPAWIRAWQNWIRSNPPAHLLTVAVFNKDGIRTRFMSMNGSWEEMAELVNGTFPPPQTVISFDQYTFPDFVVNRVAGYWPADEPEPFTDIQQLVNLTKHNAPGWKRVKAFFVDRELVTDEEISAMKTLWLEYVQHSEALIEQQGGTIAAVGPSETAYVHLGPAIFGVQLQAFNPGGQEEPMEAVAAMETFFEQSRALWNHAMSYQNYMDSALDDYLERYYGANLERLVTVKGRVDPNNVFRHPKSIPVQLS